MNKTKLLNGNVLKIIALIAMTIDHIGFFLFPEVQILRIIGRIAFPIFAFFIAEGCKYTKNKTKYFLLIFIIGLICQFVVTIFVNFYQLNIFLTFSFSIILIYIFQWVKKSIEKRNKIMIILSIVLFVSYLTVLIVLFFPNVQLFKFGVEYGFWGIMIPFFASLFDNRYLKLLCFDLGLVACCISFGGNQYYSFRCIK